MPVLEKLKVAFVHVPKSAGTSISEHLSKIGPISFHRSPVSDLNISIKNWESLHKFAMHLPYSELVRNLPNSGDYNYFTVVREPARRLSSLYHFMRGTDRNERNASLLPYEVARKSDTFVDFLSRLSDDEHLRFIASQKNYLVDGKGEICIKNVFRFEELPDSYNEYITRVGKAHGITYLLNRRSIRRPLPHRNRRKGSGAASVKFSDKELEFLEQLCSEDAVEFNYPLPGTR